MSIARTPKQPSPEPAVRPARPAVTRAAGPDSGKRQLDAGDLSLIRSMLERTPEERLEHLQDFADGVTALRDGRVER